MKINIKYLLPLIIWFTSLSSIPLSAQNWLLGLNAASTSSPAYLGTNSPYPLRIYTDNENRMHINEDISYNVNGQGSIARNGYVGIGRNQSPTTIWNNPGPISLLHLNGDEGSVLGTQGYRNWMRNSITITSNSDLMFMGPRRRGADDVTDAVLGWADNPAGPGVGPDNMLFVFSTGTGTGTDLDGGGPDGREIMRMNANGNVGIGPRFSNTAQPQSRLHINAESNFDAWIQMTNQSNTGQALNDGLKMGITGVNSYIYNQEDGHLIFSTNYDVATNLGRERMRVTHIGAPGVPVTAGNNLTRVSVSLNATDPITEPRTLMHIGAPLSGSVTDGVRNWMNVGYLSTFDSDNMYVGLKQEGDDRQDAVIAWGDNQTDLIAGSGPDNLRFIFANSQFLLSPSTNEARSDNGQEVARFTPGCNGCPINTGSLGIGNFGPTVGAGAGTPNPIGPGTAGYINATLDVNGDARIRRVNEDSTLTQMLMRNPADSGRIYWRNVNTINNGFGGLCGSPAALASTLIQDTEVPMDEYNFIFSGQDSMDARVGIGMTGCSPKAKLHVEQRAWHSQIGIYSRNTTPAVTFMSQSIWGEIENDSSVCGKMAVAGHFSAKSNSSPVGVFSEAFSDTLSSVVCTGGDFEAVGGFFLASGNQGTSVGLYTTTNGNPGDIALIADGNAYTSGTMWYVSDNSIKENVQELNNATQLLLQLRPISYDFNHSATTLNVPHGRQLGFLAQELELVFPELVSTFPIMKQTDGVLESEQNIKAVNYMGLIPELIAAFQEQNERINQLEAQLNACCNRPRGMETGDNLQIPTGAVIQTRLENKEEPTLGQNIPNPFELATRIPAYLPIGTSKAEIMFYGNDGKILQILQVNDRGNVFVDVDATTLASGVYSYTLFVDGKPVDTKRMLKK